MRRHLWLIAILMMPMGLTAQRLPFGLELRKGASLDEARAVKIYDSVCARIAREINLTQPPTLRPKFVLIIGESTRPTGRIERLESGTVRIYLRDWNEILFAYCVAVTAVSQSVPDEAMLHVVASTIKALNATVDVRDLRK